MIDTIVSDMGNVLLRFDNAIFFGKLAPYTAHSLEEIRRVTRDNLDLAVLFEKGSVSPLDFYRNVKELLDLTAGYEEFYALYVDIFALNAPVLELYRRLRPFYKMALLSSTDVMRWTFIKRRFPEILIFDAYALSFDQGAMKPDPAVFREVLGLTDTRPEEAVFIDDLRENVEGAERMGLRGIVFGPGTDLEGELARLGVKPGPLNG
ncbi:MAG: HAD-IA family hydrolase [Candidatus Aminicenantales bacterium]|jgi:putative hydrolase of the HAD superfamily